MSLCIVEKLYYYFGLKPKPLSNQSLVNRIKILKWTIFHLVLCVILAIVFLYYRNSIMSTLNDLGYAADYMKLIMLFGFLFVNYSEILWKAKNYELIHEILAEIDIKMTKIGTNMDLVKKKAHKRFLTFFITFGILYISCELWVIGIYYNHMQPRNFFFAFMYPQVIKYLSLSFFIYYITVLVIYLEAIYKEISSIYTREEKDRVFVIEKLERAYRKLETLCDVLTHTYELTLTAYIIQDSYHLFADLYWLFFKWININDVRYWPSFTPKIFIKFALFYGGQLCIDVDKLVSIRILQIGYQVSRHCEKFRTKIEQISIDTMNNRAHFNLYGYINIDARGFFVIMSNLTLYMAIFIQFIPTCENCQLIMFDQT